MTTLQGILVVLSMAIVIAIVSWWCFWGAEMSIDQRVTECISQVTGIPVDEILPGMSKTELGLDSLDETELLMAIEDEFNIEIPDNVMAHLSTVGGLVSYIKLKFPE